MYKQEIVFFDVDDTLIIGQSQKLFIEFLRRRGLVTRSFYARLMFWFVLYRLHIVKNPSVVAGYAFSFLKNMKREELHNLVELFFNKVLIKQFYQDAITKIQDHKTAGSKIFLVSNAFDTLVERIAMYVKADGFIATKLKEENGVLTGEINGIINYGQSKVESVKNFCLENNISLENSWGYADHSSDISFLKLMKNPVIVNPNRALQKKAKALNFNTLIFKK